jgi:hypothetical protein
MTPAALMGLSRIERAIEEAPAVGTRRESLRQPGLRGRQKRKAARERRGRKVKR